jgi:hypothetical protein
LRTPYGKTEAWSNYCPILDDRNLPRRCLLADMESFDAVSLLLSKIIRRSKLCSECERYCQARLENHHAGLPIENIAPKAIDV